MYRQGLLMATTALTLILAACAAETEGESPNATATEGMPTATATPEPEPTATSEPEPQNEVLQVGDTANFQQISVTVHDVRFDDGDEFSAPDEGTRWLVVDASVQNTSSETMGISSLTIFGLVDEQHIEQDWSIWTPTKGSLDGQLSAGRTMRGEIAYTVDEEATAWEFVVQPELFGTEEAIFEIRAE